MLTLLVPFIWGVNFTAAKLATNAFEPLLMAAVRAGIIVLCLVPFVPRPRGQNQWRALGWLSLIQGSLHFGLVMTGMSLSQSGDAALAYQISAPLTVVAAALVLGEAFRWLDALAIALGVAGLVALGWGAAHVSPVGLGLMVGSAVCVAASNTLVRRWGPFHAGQLTGYVSLLAVPQLLMASLLTEPAPWTQAAANPATAWLPILFTGTVSGALGYGLWYVVLQRHGAARVAPFLLLTPLFGVLSGWLVLREVITPNTLLGGGLILAGIALSQIRSKRPNPRLGAGKGQA